MVRLSWIVLLLAILAVGTWAYPGLERATWRRRYWASSSDAERRDAVMRLLGDPSPAMKEILLDQVVRSWETGDRSMRSDVMLWLGMSLSRGIPGRWSERIQIKDCHGEDYALEYEVEVLEIGVCGSYDLQIYRHGRPVYSDRSRHFICW